MIRINNVKVPLNYDEKTLLHLAGAKLNLRGGVESVRIAKKSVDARDKSDVHFVMALDVTLRDMSEEKALERLPHGVQAAIIKPNAAHTPRRDAVFAARPLVVGLGPAGLFAAWELARSGARPLDRSQMPPDIITAMMRKDFTSKNLRKKCRSSS